MEAAGFSGMLFTEGHQVPWMNIAAASMAAPSLHFSTGIAIAFARSPMISAEIAWELAQNTKGKFRLGLGSQVKAHIVRRYASPFDKPAAQMKDYVLATKACLSAFRREGPLKHEGKYYNLSLLTEQWTPPRHEYEDVKVDISAVGPIMTRVAGEVADGIHVHPMHSMHYIKHRLLPGLAEGAARAGRDPSKIDKIIPVIVAAGDTPEERATSIKEAKTTIAFYGATPNYAFQFDDLGYTGLRDQLRDCLKTGDSAKQPVADHRRDPRPVRRGGALGRRRRPHDRALQGHRLAPRDLPRLALAQCRSEDPRALGRGGARRAQGGLASAAASPVHKRPRRVDGSDADAIGISASSVRVSGTPPSTHHTAARCRHQMLREFRKLPLK